MEINIMAYPGLPATEQRLYTQAAFINKAAVYERVLKSICEALDVEERKLKSPSRKRELVWARFILFKALSSTGTSH